MGSREADRLYVDLEFFDLQPIRQLLKHVEPYSPTPLPLKDYKESLDDLIKDVETDELYRGLEPYKNDIITVVKHIQSIRPSWLGLDNVGIYRRWSNTLYNFLIDRNVEEWEEYNILKELPIARIKALLSHKA